MTKKAGTRKATTTSTTAAATAADSTAAGGLKRVHGDWQQSSVNERQLETLRRDDYLPSLEKMKTRAPGDEVSPRPHDDERVCFIDFMNRGFAFPVHDSFVG